MDFNELKNKATEVSGDVMKKASDLGEDVKTKTQNTLDAMKYKSAISDEEKRIRMIKGELADKYLEMFKDENPHEEMNVFIEKIKESEQKIEENKKLLAELKVEASETKLEMPKVSGCEVFAIVLGVIALIELLCWQCGGLKINIWYTELSMTFAQVFSTSSELASFVDPDSGIKFVNILFYLVVIANILLGVGFALFWQDNKAKRIVPAILHGIVFLAVGIFMIYLSSKTQGYIQYTAGAYLLLLSSFAGTIFGFYLQSKNQ